MELIGISQFRLPLITDTVILLTFQSKKNIVLTGIKIVSVSYTHLDVYKRQIAITAIGTIRISIGSNKVQSPKIPQNMAPRAVSTTRSGRCMKPTLHSSPKPSARART